MLRKKKVAGPRGGDDKTESSKEDMEESWEIVAMDKDELELLKPSAQEDIEANMAAGQESWVVVKDHAWDASVSSALNPLSCLAPLLFAALAC